MPSLELPRLSLLVFAILLLILLPAPPPLLLLLLVLPFPTLMAEDLSVLPPPRNVRLTVPLLTLPLTLLLLLSPACPPPTEEPVVVVIVEEERADKSPLRVPT